jgi:hypothetical protein
VVEYLLPNLKVGGWRLPCAQTLFLYTTENSGGAEKSAENSGSHAKNFFCSMYEMSQRHPVWVAENHVNPCNSVFKSTILAIFATILKEVIGFTTKICKLGG